MYDVLSLGPLILFKGFVQSHLLKAKKTADADALKAFDTQLFLWSFMFVWKKIAKDDNVVVRLRQSLAKFKKSRKLVAVLASASAPGEPLMPTVYETKQKEWHTYDEPKRQRFRSTRSRPPPQKGDKIANPCVRCQTHGETCYAQGKTAGHGGHVMDAGRRR